MIQLPRRSVTRFFIPLIDVLTLLFCIFLVMPLAQTAEDPLTEQLASKDAELDTLRNTGDDVQALQAELANLRQQLNKPATTPPTRVLEIEPRTGKLTYRDNEEIEIRNAAELHALADRDRRRIGSKAKLYYLILYPRDGGGEHPLQPELREQAAWFEGIEFWYDVPGKGLLQGPLK